MRARRTVLSVPAASERMVEKARTLEVDEVMLDLEDAVAVGMKDDARAAAAAALATGDWRAPTVALRVNAWDSPWTYRDVVEVVAAGGRVDSIVLPKAEAPEHVAALDLLLTQVERAHGRAVGAIAIEAQVESARGLRDVDAIAAASPRLEALVFGPADFIASLGLPAGSAYDADALTYAMARILVAARARDLQAIDGPFVQVRDLDGFRRSAAHAAALGYDGKWVLHPDQVTAGNEAFTPTDEEFAHATELLAAYAEATSEAGGQRGAVMFGEEMIDEASRKVAASVVARGRAAGRPRAGEDPS